jgi:hypothetical protein
MRPSPSRASSHFSLERKLGGLERKIAAGGRGSGRFAYAQRVPEVVALVRELHRRILHSAR